MNLTILGASAATQNPGGACSSYLVRHGQTALVMDMGSGSFGNLQRWMAPAEVTAVVITHMHADHVLDLMQYRYGLSFYDDPHLSRPRLLFPPQGHAKMLSISGLQDPSPTFFSDHFEVTEYDPTAPLKIGELALSFTPMRHAPHTYGIRITAGGRTLAFSADTGLTETVLSLAQGADLFLCENANAEGEHFPFHLTPTQAGAYAQQAGVKRLVLTHRWIHNSGGLNEAVQTAATRYSGPVVHAREGDLYEV